MKRFWNPSPTYSRTSIEKYLDYVTLWHAERVATEQARIVRETPKRTFVGNRYFVIEQDPV